MSLKTERITAIDAEQQQQHASLDAFLTHDSSSWPDTDSEGDLALRLDGPTSVGDSYNPGCFGPQ